MTERDGLSKCHWESVGVVGVGFVGLHLSVAFAEAGLDVVGYDVDEDRVAEVAAATSGVQSFNDDRLKRVLAGTEKFEVTADPAELADREAVVIAVPSSDSDAGVPDLGAVEAAVRTVAGKRPAGEPTLFVLASTVPPGVVDDVVVPALLDAGLTPSEDALIAHAPERLNPGGELDVEDIPVVVGGESAAARAAAVALFERVAEEVHPVASVDVAATAKLLENTYRLVNVSLVNEFARWAESAGVDLRAAIDAAATKPFGFEPFSPGAGAGGACTHTDPQFAARAARGDADRLTVVEAATAVNDRMPRAVTERILRTFADLETTVTGSTVLALGVTYKPGVSDTRNSPAIRVCELLADTGADVTFVDPLAPPDTAVSGATRAEKISQERLKKSALVVLLVPQPSFDLARIVAETDVIYDVMDAIDQDVIDHVPVSDRGRVVTFGG
jgi:nucleotide sugar dehydrogenase